MVGVLWRKSVRELWARKGALFLLVCIAAVGVSLMVGMVGVIYDLARARNAYYDSYRLADFSVTCKRAPAWALDRVAQVPNVRRIQGRISLPVRVEVPGLAEPLTGTVLSLPEHRVGALDDVLLTAGLWATERDGDVVVNAAFARARHLHPGDRITALIEDQQWSLRIVGLAMSPEYVYVVPPGGFTPDPGRSPVLFLPLRFLQRAANLESAYNEVVGTLYDTRPAAVRATLALIETRLAPYGVVYTTPRAEQPSVKFVDNEFKELWSHATILPGICLGAVAFVLHVVMGRMVAQNRGVIGTLRALGYTRGQLVRHYLSHGLLVGLLGGVLGGALGALLQGAMLRMYQDFFDIPGFRVHLYPALWLLGILVSIGFTSLGTVAAVREAAALEPARAMHPPPPERGGPILPERWALLWRALPFRWKMILRSVFRNPFRTVTTIGIIAVASGLLLESVCVQAAITTMIDDEFVRASHQDVTVTLSDPTDTEAGREVLTMDGVSRAEMALAVPCILQHGSVEKRLSVTGLSPTDLLYRPAGLTVPPRGIVLTRKLGEMLGVRPGQTLHLVPLIGLRREADVPVVGLVDTWVGLSAYADRGYLSRLIGEDDVTNTLFAATWHAPPQPSLLALLHDRPRVLGLEQRHQTRARLTRLLQQSLGLALWVSLGFTGLLAFGSVLNTALVTVSEREREVGTFRVLGYRPWEVARIFIGESMLVNGVGILAGLPVGIALLHLVTRVYNTELFRFPVVVPPLAFPQTVAVMLLFLILAQTAVTRAVSRLDWLAVFKVRE